MPSLSNLTHVQCLSESWTQQIKNQKVILLIRSKFTDISNEEMLLLQRVTATKIPQMCKIYEK